MLSLASAAMVALLLAAPPEASKDQRATGKSAAKRQVDANRIDGNRLAYLDELNPWYPQRDFPKLITPQWVGEDGVEAVVILGIDDMRGHPKWEAYLRPILDRLKKIDGRAPVSIMTCQIDPAEPHLQKWLKEGLSLECHTVDHPCPLLGKMNLAEAKSTYDRCVDQMFAVGVPPLGGIIGAEPAKAGTPTHRPVAFRTPCCDSQNTLSPRFFAEIFNQSTPRRIGSAPPGGNFLTIDSSVFCLLTPNDPALPRELVLEPGGTDRFRKYLPADRTFVNYIEDYPYPYVIDKTCWEFPCMVPSDWAAQHLHKPNNPKTVEDWKAALDAVVIKQGVFCLVFHPHNWIRPEQVNELIDHAVAKHGKKVKFLTFREAQERLDKRFGSLRFANHLERGTWSGTRLMDINHDGYLDTLGAMWEPSSRSWKSTRFPTPLTFLGISGPRHIPVRFGVVRPEGRVSMLHIGQSSGEAAFWHLDSTTWVKDEELLRGVEDNDAGVRYRWQALRDLDGDGRCELIGDVDGKAPTEYAIFTWPTAAKARKLPFGLPSGVKYDHACRFVDLDEDGDLDIVFSNAERYGIYLFEGMDKGWSRKVLEGERAKGQHEIPPFVRADGTNNGAWIANRHIYWQNEETGRDRALLDLIDRRSFNELLKSVEPAPKSPEQSLKCLKTRPGFRVELVAAEPLVMDPVAFEWGPDGKLWVVEMADYPLGLDDKGKPGGRVKYLEDLDGDGRYDKATLFLDGLRFPTDVMPWRKGVLVTAAPDIFYAEDTDGDGRADKRIVLYTGFAEGNQQHRVNGLRWGLDNWIYVSNGDSAGRVKWTGNVALSLRERKAEAPTDGKETKPQGISAHGVSGLQIVELGGRDLRIRPDTGEMDLQSGRTQHGRCRDDWGNWFGANNATPGWHYALEDHYLRRNPHVASPDSKSELTTNRHIYPRSRPISHWEGYRPPPEGQPGVITSACGHCVYRDELFGDGYAPGTAQMTDELTDLRRMTLTIIDGDFPREVIGAQNLIFGEYKMPTKRGVKWFDEKNAEEPHRPLEAPPVKKTQPTPPQGGKKPAPSDNGASMVERDGTLFTYFFDPAGMVPPIYVRDRNEIAALSDDSTLNIFMSEVVHNVVHRMVVSPKGSIFTARRAADEQRTEFLASSDSWFRPTTVKTGPDGALYVADMYRLVIEHPEWIDDKTEKKLFLRAGHDKGRIYRVVPVGAKARAIPGLDKLDTAGLVTALDSPSGWQRDLAQQMLLWRNDQAAVPMLEKLASDARRPVTRMQALCTLEGLALAADAERRAKAREAGREYKLTTLHSPTVLAKALNDSHPGVRRQAIRLCEPLLRMWSEERVAVIRDHVVARALLKLAGDSEQASDSDPQVRLQLAYTLGEWSDPRAGEALATLAQRAGDDSYLLATVMSSAPRHVATLLNASLTESRQSTSPRAADVTGKLLALALALKNNDAVASALEAIIAAGPAKTPAKEPGTKSAAADLDAQRFSQLARFLDVLSSRGTSLAKFREQAGPKLKAALDKMLAVIAAARGVAADEKSEPARKLAAIGLLGWDDAHRAADVKLLLDLLAPRTAIELQQAAVGRLVQLDDEKITTELLGHWKSLGPAVRARVLDESISRPRAVHALLEALLAGRVPVGELDLSTRDRLRNHPTPTVRGAAMLLLGKATSSSRADVIAKYRAVAQAGGDAARGLAAFKKTCANCHRSGDVGVAVGPDLATMADRSPETILTAVLDPNRAVEARYQSYSALLADGRTLTGMLSAESGGSITLLAAEGKKHEIARADIERLESSGKSLMPDGIEKDLAPQDLADVIAFLGSKRPPRRQFAGNEPKEVVPTGADDASPGSLHLTASVAELFGQQIVFEPHFKNLGYWSGPHDHALWKIDVARAGKYEVWLDWACDQSAAGNPFVLQISSQRISGHGATGPQLTGRVEGTGTWEVYRRKQIGVLELPAGKQEVTFRPGAGFQGTLIDLREVRLTPISR